MQTIANFLVIFLKITYACVIKMRIVMTTDSIIDYLQILGRLHVKTGNVANTPRNL